MSRQSLCFLAIEPDEAYQKLLRQAVLENGYGDTIGLATLRDGVTAVAAGRVDFVICDWSDDAGPEIGFVKLLKKQESFRFIPVLFTAPAQPNTADRLKRAVAAGVDGYLLKPYTPAQLKSAVEEILLKYPAS